MSKSPKASPRKAVVEHAPSEHSHVYLNTLRLTGRKPTQSTRSIFKEHHGKLVRVDS